MARTAAQDGQPTGRVSLARLDQKARLHIEKLTARVDRELEAILAEAKDAPPVLMEAVRYALFTGGKRFRPLLVLGGCETLGGRPSQAMCVACAIELIHTYSLVHDDLPAMDNADVRRGQPSCHKQFDEATAILAGDGLLTLSFEILGGVRNENAAEITRRIARAAGLSGLIGGQVLDLQALARPEGVSERMLRDIAQRKTAALINVSVITGALCGGASAAQLRRLDQYGQSLGLAFQLIDDVHDRDGLVGKVSLENVRREAQGLIRKAADALKPFGDDAAVLRHLANWLGATL